MLRKTGAILLFLLIVLLTTINAGELIVSGGTFELKNGTSITLSTVTVNIAGLLDMQGGDISTQKIQIYTSTMNLTSGNINTSSITVTSSGLLTMYGGIIYTDQLFVSPGTITINNGTINSTNVIVNTSGNLEVKGGNINTDLILISAGNISLETDGTVNSPTVTVKSNGVISLEGGTFNSYDFSMSTSTLNIYNGTLDSDIINISTNSIFSMQGGEVSPTILTISSSAMNINAGTIKQSDINIANTVITIDGGTIEQGPLSISSGTVNMSAGTIYSSPITINTKNLFTFDGGLIDTNEMNILTSTLNINNGTLDSNNLSLFLANLNMTNGTLNSSNMILANPLCSVDIQGGDINATNIVISSTSLTASNCTFDSNNTTINNKSVFSINSGTIDIGDTVVSSATLNINNGTIQNSKIALNSGSVLDIQNGNIDLETLIISSGITSINTDITCSSITIDSHGTFDVIEGSVYVKGAWENNNGTYNSNNNDIIFIDNSKLSFVKGNSTFYNFVCTTPKKTIYFQESSTQIITNLFIIQGPGPNNKINLASTIEENYWYLGLYSSQTVRYVDASDSYVYAADGSLNEYDVIGERFFNTPSVQIVHTRWWLTGEFVPPKWKSPSDGQGFTLNSRPKLWFEAPDGRTYYNAVVTLATDENFSQNVRYSTYTNRLVTNDIWEGWSASAPHYISPAQVSTFTISSPLIREATWYAKVQFQDENLFWGAQTPVLKFRVEKDSSTFFSEPIVAGQTLIKPDHFIELQNCIKELQKFRIVYSTQSWSNFSSELTAGKPIRAAHLNELRDNLEKALNSVGESYGWTNKDNNGNVSSGTVIRKKHIDELRENCGKP